MSAREQPPFWLHDKECINPAYEEWRDWYNDIASLPLRARNHLVNRGITHTGHLTEVRRSWVANRGGCGPKMMAEIDAFMEERGMSFAPDDWDEKSMRENWEDRIASEKRSLSKQIARRVLAVIEDELGFLPKKYR